MKQETSPQSPIQTRLAALPAALDLTHEQTSAYLGVSPHTLRKWVSGERDPGALLLRALDLLDLVRTLAPSIHDAIVTEARGIPAPRVKRAYTRKMDPKAPKSDLEKMDQISQKFSPRAHTANLVDSDFSGNAPTHIPATAVDTLKPVLSAEVARKPDPDDVLVWADNTWCYRSESESMSHMSDDYRVLFAESPEWVAFPTD